MHIQRTVGVRGDLTVRRIPAPDEAKPKSFWQTVKLGLPITGDKRIDRYRWKNLPNLWRGLWRVSVARALNVCHAYGALYITVIRADGTREILGLVSLRVVTTTGVNFLVDAFQNTTELENLKFHGFGSGGAAEAVGNTALTTEFTTEYQTNSTRPTGTTTEGASANIYRTVATFTPDAAVAVTEHGIFDQAATGGGTLWDRTLFSVINLNGTGDAIQSTYDCTFAAGS